jgi:hypothetical protein
VPGPQHPAATPVSQAAGATRERAVSVDTGRRRVLDVLQPYIDDLTRRNERGARRAAADIAIAVLFGLYECREDTDQAG